MNKNRLNNMEKFEKLDNEQKKLVKYWIEKFNSEIYDGYTTCYEFTKKHLTPEPVIEVEKWYKSTRDRSTILFYLSKIDGIRCIGYGFGATGSWKEDGTHFFESTSSYLTEATREEVEQRLIEEANRRGYKPYQKMIDADGIHTNGFTESEFKYFMHEGNLCLHTHVYPIMKNGKWAEIIDEKAEVKAEIDSITKRLEELKSKL